MTASNEKRDFQIQAKNINRKPSSEESSRNLVLSSDFLRLPLRETSSPLCDSQAEPERVGSCAPEEALPRQLRVPDSTQSL